MKPRRPATITRRATLRRLVASWLSAGPLAALAAARRSKPSTKGDPAPIWHPDHTVIVILENLSAFEATEAQLKRGDAPVFGNSSNWRYLNELASQGARFTNSHFTRTPYGSDLPTRPSQPNYLYLFSGHHQGVLPAWFEDTRSPYLGEALYDWQGQLLASARQTNIGVGNNNLPDAWLPLTSPNLGAALMQSGRSFASFSESLPYPSWNCATDDALAACSGAQAQTDFYRRKHNAAINWTDQIAPTSRRGLKGDLAHHVLPVHANLGFAPTNDPVLKKAFRGFDKDAQGRPLPFSKLPNVSIVVPNEQHDAHSNSAQVADDWLRQNIGAYAAWAKANNSLLIVTFDEDGITDTSRGNGYITGVGRIPTLFFGAGVRQGKFAGRVDHLNILATVLWLNGALARFKADFRQFHLVVDGSGSEAEKEWLNLRPVTEVFRAR
ncbi:alkaline phosphatase family protein [Aquabacterium sp. CECT 9606]|uniref:alkaline phosphatase family protein n=1 Tax=Aquabacterium sp. CECT 9606 TaxID=2845822 RepID=UPI001E5E84B7|nr:alkaline phosphatase family protein [Aquabacterium sp. CECT 9606]CAH0350328.1 Phosphatidylinositol-3-phosphatase [Aquabacterium sp. CECT 9606]